MNRKLTITVLIAVFLIIIISAILVLQLYQLTIDKKEDIHVELIKIITQGVIIGVLGIWIKFLIEEASKRRDRERIKNELFVSLEKDKKNKLLNIFMGMRKICSSTIKNYDGTQYSSATQLLSGYNDGNNITYEDLIDDWQLFEPEGDYKKAHDAYNWLYKKMKNDDNITKEKRQLIRNKYEMWKKYYDRRIQNLLTNKVIDQKIEW